MNGNRFHRPLCFSFVRHITQHHPGLRRKRDLRVRAAGKQPGTFIVYNDALAALVIFEISADSSATSSLLAQLLCQELGFPSW